MYYTITAVATTTASSPFVFSSLCAGAESGWDYSSRWFNDSAEISSIFTTQILPVELNGLLYRNERLLASFFSTVGDASKSAAYTKAAEVRLSAMTQVMFDTASNQWKDIVLEGTSPNGDIFTRWSQRGVGVSSNFLPLAFGLHSSPNVDASAVVEALRTSNLVLPGGVTTTDDTHPIGQQWDFPNAWAPVQMMLIEGLQSVQTTAANELARKLSQDWMCSLYKAYAEHGFLYEKYDSRHQGAIGGGGEYSVQTGFGWTNGVALIILEKYPNMDASLCT